MGMMGIPTMGAFMAVSHQSIGLALSRDAFIPDAFVQTFVPNLFQRLLPLDHFDLKSITNIFIFSLLRLPRIYLTKSVEACEVTHTMPSTRIYRSIVHNMS